MKIHPFRLLALLRFAYYGDGFVSQASAVGRVPRPEPSPLGARPTRGCHFIVRASIALLCEPFLAAQPVDDTQLKQVIIFGRHGVRTPILPNTVAGPGLALDTFSALPT
jgi:hypothetical protein